MLGSRAGKFDDVRCDLEMLRVSGWPLETTGVSLVRAGKFDDVRCELEMLRVSSWPKHAATGVFSTEVMSVDE